MSVRKKLVYALETLKALCKQGFARVSRKEKERRISICKGCEHYRELCGQPRCNECGCFASIKAELKAAKCPCGKW